MIGNGTRGQPRRLGSLAEGTDVEGLSSPPRAPCVLTYSGDALARRHEQAVAVRAAEAEIGCAAPAG